MDDVVPLSPVTAVRRRWFLLGLAVLFVGLSVKYSVKLYHHGDSSSAFNRWRPQVQSLVEGADAYELYNYPNPPMMALLLYPYYKLPEFAGPHNKGGRHLGSDGFRRSDPFIVGPLAWYYTKVALAVASLLLVFRLVESPGRTLPLWAKGLVVLLSLKPIMGDLTHGNVNLVILFMVVAALYAFRTQRDVMAGLVLSLAIVCKVTPALFLPYLVWKRAWKTLASCTAGMVLFYLVVPGLFLGMAHNAHLLGSWAEVMIKPFVVDGKVAYSEHPNQSIPGLVYRLLTDSPSFSEWIDDAIYHPLRYDNFASLSFGQARMVILGCMALFAGMVLWVCRTPTSARQGLGLAAEYSIVLLGMLLFSERTWKHHCVTLVLPLAVACYRLAWTSERRERVALATVLAVVALLLGSTSMPGMEKWDELGRLAQVYGAFTWVNVILTATMATIVVRGQSLAAPMPAPGPIEEECCVASDKTLSHVA